jgi:hypothetical protein
LHSERSQWPIRGNRSEGANRQEISGRGPPRRLDSTCRRRCSPGPKKMIAGHFRFWPISDELLSVANVWNRPESRSRRPRFFGFAPRLTTHGRTMGQHSLPRMRCVAVVRSQPGKHNPSILLIQIDGSHQRCDSTGKFTSADSPARRSAGRREIRDIGLQGGTMCPVPALSLLPFIRRSDTATGTECRRDGPLSSPQSSAIPPWFAHPRERPYPTVTVLARSPERLCS